MKTVKIGKHDIMLYDDISELPMRRFHRFNKMLLVDSGIGSDLSDIDRHLERIKAFIRKEKKDEALAEIENIRTNFYFIGQNLCPRYLAFATLVAELDGKPCDDLSDDGLQKVVDALGDVPMPTLNAEFEAAKKKIEDDLVVYFPSMFDDPTVKEYYDMIRSRTIAVLDEITHGADEETERKIDDITNSILTYSAPQNFRGTDSVEIQFDRNFERMCHIISYHLNVSPKDYTVTEYYSAFNYIKEIIKAKKMPAKFK